MRRGTEEEEEEEGDPGAALGCVGQRLLCPPCSGWDPPRSRSRSRGSAEVNVSHSQEMGRLSLCRSPKPGQSEQRWFREAAAAPSACLCSTNRKGGIFVSERSPLRALSGPAAAGRPGQVRPVQAAGGVGGGVVTTAPEA